MRAINTDTGLTAQQERFAQLIAQGWSQVGAYTQVYQTETVNRDTQIECASRLASNHNIAARVRALLAAAKLQDIWSIGEWFNDVKRLTAKAEADGNMTAVMSGLRIAGQALGPLRENINVSIENRITDVQLVQLLSRGDEARARQIADMIGADDFDTESSR